MTTFASVAEAVANFAGQGFYTTNNGQGYRIMTDGKQSVRIIHRGLLDVYSYFIDENGLPIA